MSASLPISPFEVPVAVPPGENELPYSFGPRMESDQHFEAMRILVESLRLHWADRDDAYVAGNMALYFSELQIKKNDFIGPDVFVVLDTVIRVRKSWVVWQEERTPDLVVELLSESTESNDRGPKMRIYARTLHVPEYFLFDPLDWRFEGYRLDPDRLVYVPMERAPDGGYTSRRLGLRLAVRDAIFLGEPARWLRWLTPDGRVLPTPREQALAAQAEADAARTEADAARTEADAARTEADAARTEADAERRRADALEARLRALGQDPGTR